MEVDLPQMLILLVTLYSLDLSRVLFSRKYIVKIIGIQWLDDAPFSSATQSVHVVLSV